MMTKNRVQSFATSSAGPVVPDSSTGSRRTFQEQRKHKTLRRSFFRIASNLVAAGLILLSLATVTVLVNTGMFHRRVLINDLTYDSTYYSAYGQSCRLDAQGFVAHTCTDVEAHTMTQAAWSALGQRLALQWLATSSSPYYVTTCIEGPLSGWAALVLIAGYDTFPECQPPGGAQEIAGIAMAETTIREDYPFGAYMLAVFADKTMQDSVVHVNSDGTTDLVIAYTNHSLISVDGIVTPDFIGINTVEHSLPLGRRYMITAFAYETIMDYTQRLDTSSMPWWNVGRTSQKVVSISWDTGHDVANSRELVSVQVALSFLALTLVASDLYLTFEGLEGYLLHKPIMTYDLLAGLERRRLLLVATCLGTLPSLLYAEVARIYFGTVNGDLIWYLSTILIGIFFAFATLLGVAVVQVVPTPTTKLVPFSPALFCYGTIVSLVLVWSNQYVRLGIEFNNAPFELALNVSGVFRPSGAYASGGINTVMDLMGMQSCLTTMLCLLLSMVYRSVRRKVQTGTFFVDVTWTTTNSFLANCGTPNWISGLPLDPQNVTGHEALACTPSTQAAMGFAMILDRQDETQSCSRVASGTSNVVTTQSRMQLVSVYYLLPTLWNVCKVVPEWLSPTVYGIVEKNTFARKRQRIGHHDYLHHRGTCIY
ncbi:Aste57867_9710 [Aphanomyces stellatus]|uniref:Aste57867_9710 protein n=1 Tax=Aphanomyces stellatus TaxID=120398 RepID=A0A485KNV8_9STRA|nr:hypothetical protein As57867_009672 [Aphanomyces stellatus]VFT86589.1 Aste57867_9710 [Aphanomyces stellatus]